jgi:hypothetical protein
MVLELAKAGNFHQRPSMDDVHPDQRTGLRAPHDLAPQLHQIFLNSLPEHVAQTLLGYPQDLAEIFSPMSVHKEPNTTLGLAMLRTLTRGGAVSRDRRINLENRKSTLEVISFEQLDPHHQITVALGLIFFHSKEVVRSVHEVKDGKPTQTQEQKRVMFNDLIGTHCGQEPLTPAVVIDLLAPHLRRENYGMIHSSFTIPLPAYTPPTERQPEPGHPTVVKVDVKQTPVQKPPDSPLIISETSILPEKPFFSSIPGYSEGTRLVFESDNYAEIQMTEAAVVRYLREIQLSFTNDERRTSHRFVGDALDYIKKKPRSFEVTLITGEEIILTFSRLGFLDRLRRNSHDFTYRFTASTNKSK